MIAKIAIALFLPHLAFAATEIALVIEQSSQRVGHQEAYLFEEEIVKRTTNSNFIEPDQAKVLLGLFERKKSESLRSLQSQLDEFKNKSSNQKHTEESPHALRVEINGVKIQDKKSVEAILALVRKLRETDGWEPIDAVEFSRAKGEWTGRILKSKASKVLPPSCEVLPDKREFCRVTDWGYFFSEK